MRFIRVLNEFIQANHSLDNAVLTSIMVLFSKHGGFRSCTLTGFECGHQDGTYPTIPV